MGYRYYMYAISKEKLKEIENLSPEELLEHFREEDWICIHKIPDREVYMLGEIPADIVNRIYSVGKPMFKNQDSQKYLEHYKPYVIGKEGLIETIQAYREKVIKYYQGLLVDDDEETAIIPRTAIEKQTKHIQGVIREWERNIAVNLNPDNEFITFSWTYEYSTFELARILKTFDFKKETIIFYGW